MQFLHHVCYVTIACVFATAIYIATQYVGVMKMGEGNETMSKLAGKIRSGAFIFLYAMYKRIVIVSAVVAAVVYFFIEQMAALAFVAGLLCTTISVVVALIVSTHANVRATAVALSNMCEKEDVACARTVNATMKASQICGLIVHSMVLLGLAVIILLSGEGSFVRAEGELIIPIVARLTGYSLGWSMVALFCRIAGGIFTKAADIGADNVGKTEFHMAEDSPLNPGFICDNTGDNIGDVSAMSADLGESFACTPVVTIIAAINILSRVSDPAMLSLFVAYPIILALGGLISSIVGLYFASHAKASSDPGRQINGSLIVATVGTLATSLVASSILFYGREIPADFRLGWSSPFWSATCGIAAGVAVGLVVKHFTDLDSPWAKKVADAATDGAASTISAACTAGWISVCPEVLVVAAFSYVSSLIAGPYGQATMALGMLSFVAQPIAVDAQGAIADNAGGIATASKLPPEVRRITDLMDANGNSAAAVGKGFAIGSAAAVVISQISTYQAAYGQSTLDVLKPQVMFGVFIGASALPLFCGVLGVYLERGAHVMSEAIREQLSGMGLNVMDVWNGNKEPDSDACTKVASEFALDGMLVPVAIPVLTTIAVGFIIGPEAFGGALLGTIMSGLVLAIYFSNSGGVADNAKKRYEANLQRGYEQNTEYYSIAHDAAVNGDTFGDGNKDLNAVCVDIFAKIMGNLGLMLATLFAAHCIIPMI